MWVIFNDRELFHQNNQLPHTKQCQAVVDAVNLFTATGVVADRLL